MSRITAILRQTAEHFIAETDTGTLRVGMTDIAAVETTKHSDRIRAVAAISDDAEFDQAAAAFFDDLHEAMPVGESGAVSVEASVPADGEERAPPINIDKAIRNAVSALHGAADDGADTRRYADALHEAGGVVAELIAAAKFLRARIITTNGADCVDRLDAVLERVGGWK